MSVCRFAAFATFVFVSGFARLSCDRFSRNGKQTRNRLTGRTQCLVGQTLAVIVKSFPYSRRSAKFKRPSLSFLTTSHLVLLCTFFHVLLLSRIFRKSIKHQTSNKATRAPALALPCPIGASRPFRLTPRVTGAVSRAGKPITLFFVPVSRENKTCCILPQTAQTSTARQLLLLGSGGGRGTMHNAQSGPIMSPSVDMRICLAANARSPVLL